MNKIEELLAHIQAIFHDKILADYYDTFTEIKIWIEDSDIAKKIIAHVVLPEDLPEEKTFQINNPKNKEIVVLAVDGNGIVGNSEESCDAVSFDDTCVCFKEFKYNATSDKDNAINKNIKKGTEQLEASIKKFETDIIISMGYKIEAYFGKPPIYPKTNAKLQRRAVRFSNLYRVTLKEENSKTF